MSGKLTNALVAAACASALGLELWGLESHFEHKAKTAAEEAGYTQVTLKPVFWNVSPGCKLWKERYAATFSGLAKDGTPTTARVCLGATPRIVPVPPKG